MYAFDVDPAVKMFIEANKGRIGAIYNFSTAAVVQSTYAQVEKAARACGVTMAKEEFHCRGSFGFLHKGRPNDEDLNAAKDFARQIIVKKQ